MEDQVRGRFFKNYNAEVIIRQAYGMSEATLATLRVSNIIKPGSVGEAIPGVYCKVRLQELLRIMIPAKYCLKFVFFAP